jgi:inosine-uridine nucleoside N-ribohydrolase
MQTIRNRTTPWRSWLGTEPRAPASGLATLLRSRNGVLLSLTLLALSTFALCAPAAEPVRLIFDTDMGNDIDDAIALAVIHALESRGEVQLLAVTVTKDNRWAAPYIDLVNTFYGRPEIPIGVVHQGKTPKDSDYLMKPARERDDAGRYIYPHDLKDGTNAPEAVDLLRKTLEQQPDHAVTIAQVGFSTNLARLLQSPGGTELVKRKVKLLALMAGNFVHGQPEYNVYTDAESARYLFEHWPTPMVFSGYEVGLEAKFTFQSIKKDFNYTPHHPIAEAYRIYLPKGEDRPSWDPTAVLYAIRPDRGYFGLSEPGRVALGPKNTTVFTPASSGNCRYLQLDPVRAARVLAVLETLASEPPGNKLPPVSNQRSAEKVP